MILPETTLNLACEALAGGPALSDSAGKAALFLAEKWLEKFRQSYSLDCLYAGVTSNPEAALFDHAGVRRVGCWCWFQLPVAYQAVRLRDVLLSQESQAGLQFLSLNLDIDTTQVYVYAFANADANLMQVRPGQWHSSRRLTPPAVYLTEERTGWKLRAEGLASGYQRAEFLRDALPKALALAAERELEFAIDWSSVGITARWGIG